MNTYKKIKTLANGQSKSLQSPTKVKHKLWLPQPNTVALFEVLDGNLSSYFKPFEAFHQDQLTSCDLVRKSIRK